MVRGTLKAPGHGVKNAFGRSAPATTNECISRLQQRTVCSGLYVTQLGLGYVVIVGFTHGFGQHAVQGEAHCLVHDAGTAAKYCQW